MAVFFVELLSKTLIDTMKEQQSKEYWSPQFQLVRQDEQNKIFFTASGGPGPGPSPKSAGATLSNVSSW